MKTVKLIYFSLCFFFVFTYRSFAQKHEILDSLRSPTYIDSLLIDHNRANYSFRIFANFKNQSFYFNDGMHTAKFIPNNRSGVGVGFASKKILVDIAFNIKKEEDYPTDRFDLRASFKEKRHFIDYFFQHYKGFNFENPQLQRKTFRPDIVSITNGMNYLYLFNDKNYQVGTLRSVISEGFSTGFSYGLGGFALALSQKGDSAIISTDISYGDKKLGIDKTFGIGGGVLGGIGGFFHMGNRLYSSVTLNTGIGLIHKNVSGLPALKASSKPWIYQLNTTAVMGYVRKRYYLNLSLELGFYGTEIIKNTHELLNISQAKVAFGYKIFK